MCEKPVKEATKSRFSDPVTAHVENARVSGVPKKLEHKRPGVLECGLLGLEHACGVLVLY